MGLHESFDLAQFLFGNETPLIDGTIIDESLTNGNDRKVIGGVATTYATDQEHNHSGRITSGSIAELSVALWFKSSNAGLQTMMGEYRTQTIGGDRSWVVMLDAGKVRIRLSQSGALVGNIKDWETIATYNDGGWHHVALTFDNGTPIIYIDGRPIADADLTKTTD